MQLTKQLNEATDQYYKKAVSVMSDYDFDVKLKELGLLEAKFPEHKQPNSPVDRVGSDLTSGFEKTKHVFPMLSIGNTYNKGELSEFLDSVEYLRKACPSKAGAFYTCEIKIDGTSMTVVYEDGKLKKAITRGTGELGDDVTLNAKTITNIPLEIPVMGRFEVRGEVYLPKQAFLDYNAKAVLEGRKTFANARNASSGTLKTKRTLEVARRGLKFMAFGLVGSQVKPTHSENMKWLKSMGFQANPVSPCSNIEDIWKVVNKIQGGREKFEFDMDGAVIKLNHLFAQEEAGATSKAPRWCIAYKYPAESVKTKSLSVDLQVGRTGRITPVVNLVPVQVAGTTVKRATLHNFEEIKRLGFMIGDTVALEKGGEIIPKITAVYKDERPDDAESLVDISCCPECGADLDKSDVDYRCTNFLECAPQVQKRVEHFVGRDYMNMDDIGPSLIEQLLDASYIKSPLDLFKLNMDMLESLDRMAEKSAKNVMASVEKSKANSAERVLAAMGIRHVGRKASKLLAKKFKSLEGIWNASYEAIESIDGIGEGIAKSARDYISKNPEFPAEVAGLGINTEYLDDSTGNQFDGMTVVLTGTLPNYKRPELAKLIEAAGGEVGSSVSKKTDLLVAGEKAGSKLTKAEGLGIKIVDEAYVTGVLGL